MRWSLSTRGTCSASDRFPLSPCSNLGVVAAAEPLPLVAPHRPHFASDRASGWFLGDDLSALETLAGLDACAASAGVAMLLLSNSVPMNSVVRFINPPYHSLEFGRFDREWLSPRAGTGGRFTNPEKQKRNEFGGGPERPPERGYVRRVRRRPVLFWLSCVCRVVSHYMRWSSAFAG
jgi:hypothetical protein